MLYTLLLIMLLYVGNGFMVRPIIGPWTGRVVNTPRPAPIPNQGKSIPLPGKGSTPGGRTTA